LYAGDEVGESYHNLETVAQSMISPNTTTDPAASIPTIDWLKVSHGIGYFWLNLTALTAFFDQSRWSSHVRSLCCDR